MSDPRRELAWCLLGPDLLRVNPLPLPGLTAWLDSLSDEAIEAHFDGLPDQLGRRFERHWEWAFSQRPSWSVHAADVQIILDGRTLGAPDLLLSHGDTAWHVELAVKFYLCRPGKTGWETSHWAGPRGNDRLDRKLSRLQEHQLPLLQRPGVQQWLVDRGLPIPTRQAAIIKGILFEHWIQQTTGPAEIRPAGCWCWQSELLEAVPAADVLRHEMWLGDATDAVSLTGQSLVYAVEHHVNTSGSVQLWAQNKRWFVVPDGWPDSI
ncbi:MAG: hypothetical protein ACI8RZ_001154 [Myxococcota bacterium]|jgi:hypothetical protein